MNLNADPIAALLEAPKAGVLAVISGVEGPSYRPIGAMMAILSDDVRVGSLSSGCIESDLALQAQKTLQTGHAETVVYGLGSPYMDIKLPCGGGLEILLVPDPDKKTLQDMCDLRQQRLPFILHINRASGALDISECAETKNQRGIFDIQIIPEINFYIFGKGPEASTFAGLVQSAGYQNTVFSPDTETLHIAGLLGSPTVHLKTPGFPNSEHPDRWSAVVLFFHDHEWEPPILQGALATDAFYVGAQGSLKAREKRLLELKNLGVPDTGIARIKGPIGLVPSAKDARTLAVSVLAEILSLPR